MFAVLLGVKRARRFGGGGSEVVAERAGGGEMGFGGMEIESRCMGTKRITTRSGISSSGRQGIN